MLAFSVIPLRALQALGVRVLLTEAEDYVCAWRVIGEMLGIATDVVRGDLEQAEAVAAAVATRNHRPSTDGALMTRALLELMTSSLPRQLDAAPAALMRYLPGDELCDMLEVPRREWKPLARLSPRVGRIMDLAQSAPVLSRVATSMGTMLLNRKAFALAGRQRSASFAIPVPPTPDRNWTPVVSSRCRAATAAKRRTAGFRREPGAPPGSRPRRGGAARAAELERPADAYWTKFSSRR